MSLDCLFLYKIDGKVGDLVPLFYFHLATESMDHKSQPGALFPQTFCSIFLIEMKERHCDPGPCIHKWCDACGLTRKKQVS